MKKIIYIISMCLITQFAYPAGGDSSSDNKSNYYNDAKKLVKRAGKLEKKEKTDKAKKLYSEAFKKLEKAYSSDKNNPDIKNSIFISNEHFKLYIHSNRISLHKRGYRNKIHKAALNESLAAGLVMLSNWNKIDPFYDTMCGSGTIAIEAALIAHNIAPGLFRKEFSFQKWQDYDLSLIHI